VCTYEKGRKNLCDEERKRGTMGDDEEKGKGPATGSRAPALVLIKLIMSRGKIARSGLQPRNRSLDQKSCRQ
jgi:hypothetical protein